MIARITCHAQREKALFFIFLLLVSHPVAGNRAESLERVQQFSNVDRHSANQALASEQRALGAELQALFKHESCSCELIEAVVKDTKAEKQSAFILGVVKGVITAIGLGAVTAEGAELIAGGHHHAPAELIAAKETLGKAHWTLAWGEMVHGEVELLEMVGHELHPEGEDFAETDTTQDKIQKSLELMQRYQKDLEYEKMKHGKTKKKIKSNLEKKVEEYCTSIAFQSFTEQWIKAIRETVSNEFVQVNRTLTPIIIQTREINGKRISNADKKANIQKLFVDRWITGFNEHARGGDKTFKAWYELPREWETHPSQGGISDQANTKFHFGHCQEVFSTCENETGICLSRYMRKEIELAVDDAQPLDLLDQALSLMMKDAKYTRHQQCQKLHNMTTVESHDTSQAHQNRINVMKTKMDVLASVIVQLEKQSMGEETQKAIALHLKRKQQHHDIQAGLAVAGVTVAIAIILGTTFGMATPILMALGGASFTLGTAGTIHEFEKWHASKEDLETLREIMEERCDCGSCDCAGNEGRAPGGKCATCCALQVVVVSEEVIDEEEREQNVIQSSFESNLYDEQSCDDPSTVGLCPWMELQTGTPWKMFYHREETKLYMPQAKQDVKTCRK